jgi:hypothetical protein
MKPQDHSVVTMWGGRIARYQHSTGELNAAHDPFGVAPVMFKHAFFYEAWVLKRFSTETASLTNERTKVTATFCGVELSAEATFVVTQRDGSVHYVLCTKNRRKPPGFSALTRIAKANGAQVVLMDRDDVRGQVDRFWTFELLRQCATIHARMGLDLDEPLMRAIKAGAKTVRDLAATVGQPCEALVRARLAHLHIAGLAIIDFDSPDLAVSLAPGRAQ